MFGKNNNDLNKSLKGSFLLSNFTGDGVKHPIPNRGQSTLKTVKGDKHYDNPGNFEGTGIVRRAD